MDFGKDDGGPPGHGPMMMERVRAHDWAATSVGALADWPQSLCTAVDIMLHAGQAMCLIWGADRIQIYNDEYARILGGRHPEALGLSAAGTWRERWDVLHPLIDRAFAGERVAIRDQPITMTRHGIDEQSWWNFAYSPVHDESGRIAGLLNICSDSTERIRALRDRDRAFENLRERESFTGSVLASSTDCIKVLDLDGKLAFMSDGGQRVMEVSDFNAILGCPWPDFWTGDGHREARAALEAARAGQSSSFIGRASTMKGNWKWWHVAVSPIFDADGRWDRILSVSRDITDLRESEEERDRFVRLVENSTDFVAMAHLDGRIFFMNDAARSIVGLEDVDYTSLSIADFFLPDALEIVMQEALPAVAERGSWSGDVLFRHFGTGELIPMLYSVFPITDASGEMVGYGTVTRDIRERKQAEEDMRYLNGELAHRLKNVLSVIQSVAQQTLRNSPDTQTAANALSARLVALGGATDILTGKSWRSADLRELAERTLAPHGGIGERIIIDGPPIVLQPEASMAFALALHELATNAAKYGALSNDTGIATLHWSVDGVEDDARLSVQWSERGGPPVTPPRCKGFGSVLIERSLRSYFKELSATDYRPEGLMLKLRGRLADAAL
ncbi:PAS domain-containing protein [Sphingomonas parapaucimobilis]|uniref:PAS domain-containing sensor histidine kinase n=1 Tax=Sphingomonas parapaucimobilis TaxID=28213 RepID=UPI0039EB0920